MNLRLGNGMSDGPPGTVVVPASAAAKTHPLKWPTIRAAAVHSVTVAISCLVSYLLVTQALAHVYSMSTSDDLLGGMWAVVATVFVYRETPLHAWEQPVLRVVDTILGVAVGLAASWTTTRLLVGRGR